MTIEKLQRVLWRLRTKYPEKNRKIPKIELQRAIILEIGTHPDTHKRNRHALRQLGWVLADGKNYIVLSGKDLTET